MQINKFLLLIIFIVSCSHSHVLTWVPREDEIPYDVYGSYIEVKTLGGALIRGELIAITDDSIFIARDSLISIAISRISNAQLIVYRPYSKVSRLSNVGIISWTFIGVISTITHGIFLLFTAPGWIVSGILSITIKSISEQPLILNYPYHVKSISSFKPFARYPQGLPPDIDRNSIKMGR